MTRYAVAKLDLSFVESIEGPLTAKEAKARFDDMSQRGASAVLVELESTSFIVRQATGISLRDFRADGTRVDAVKRALRNAGLIGLAGAPAGKSPAAVAV